MCEFNVPVSPPVSVIDMDGWVDGWDVRYTIPMQLATPAV